MSASPRDAENAVIGSILLDPSVLTIAAGVLKPSDFFDVLNGHIFKAMLEIDADHEPVDLVTVCTRLHNDQLLKDNGGACYLDQLMRIPSACNISKYVRIVSDDAIRRNICKFADELKLKASTTIRDCGEFVQAASDELFSITAGKTLSPWNGFDSCVKATLEELMSPCETGVKTGFVDLDRMITGLKPGSLTILAARPAMGKTALALNFLANAAIHSGVKTAFFSLEMTSTELTTRVLSALADVDGTALRRRDLNDLDWARLMTAVQKYSKAPIVIDETSGISIAALRERARRIQRERGLDFIIIDYLQLMTSTSKRALNREQEIADISRGLKGLAKDLNIPVLALAQLNRSVEGRTDKRPFLSDLRESGSIEQDADNIMFIHRQSYYEKTKPTGADVAEVIIAKQRSGSTGTVNLAWNAQFTKFTNYSSHF